MSSDYDYSDDEGNYYDDDDDMMDAQEDGWCLRSSVLGFAMLITAPVTLN
jgi:hypothetical protein